MQFNQNLKHFSAMKSFLVMKSTQQTALLPALVIVGGALISGCSGTGENRAIVTGRVTYNNVPVADGLIRFVPTGDTKGNITVTRISEGAYRSDGIGGVPIGTHRVEIRSFDPNDKRSGLGPARAQFLPDKYNKQSELTADLTGKSGVVTIDFDLGP